jgi:hypothetical protein
VANGSTRGLPGKYLGATRGLLRSYSGSSWVTIAELPGNYHRPATRELLGNPVRNSAIFLLNGLSASLIFLTDSSALLSPNYAKPINMSAKFNWVGKNETCSGTASQWELLDVSALEGEDSGPFVSSACGRTRSLRMFAFVKP